MTTNPEVSEAARRRTDLIAGLHGLAAWLTTHPGIPLPVVHANFRVPAGERGEQVIWLDELAGHLGTEVTVTGDGSGTLIAARQFGPVQAEGHLAPEDRSMSAWRARQAQDGAAA